jgi:hypothetical protein
MAGLAWRGQPAGVYLASQGPRSGAPLPPERGMPSLGRAGAILPLFCPTALHRTAWTRTTLNYKPIEPLADQDECNSAEPCRTEPDEPHPAEPQGRRFDPVPAHHIRPGQQVHSGTAGGRQLVPLGGLS